MPKKEPEDRIMVYNVEDGIGGKFVVIKMPLDAAEIVKQTLLEPRAHMDNLVGMLDSAIKYTEANRVFTGYIERD